VVRTVVVVIDSVGVGALPDADAFGDAGAHTLDHTVASVGVRLPNLEQLGLGCVEGVHALPCVSSPQGAYGRMLEVSPGKDTTTGHWEFMGVVSSQPFKTFERFPDAVMQRFDALTGRGHLGNVPASGTEIIARLGGTHLDTCLPIVYTSADSVFQVAAHVDRVPLETLYAWCQGARELLQGEHAVARVIARPFTGEPGAFERLNGARKDFSLHPPRNVLDALSEGGVDVVSVGKIADIYDGSGITRRITSKDNGAGIAGVREALKTLERGVVFANLVDFDAVFGHRRNVQGYADALVAFDQALPSIMGDLEHDDALMIVSDHGNDPTWHGTDHTREYGLILGHGAAVKAGDLGTRQTFADVGATLAARHGVVWDGPGTVMAAFLP
jgi:phosphopentomutase